MKPIVIVDYGLANLRSVQKALEKVGHSHRQVLREGRVEESTTFESDLDCFKGELPPPSAPPETLAFGLSELPEVRGQVAGQSSAASTVFQRANRLENEAMALWSAYVSESEEAP